MSQAANEVLENSELTKLKQGTYSDILFVLLPFLAILLQRLWSGEMDKMLLGYELSTASAILGGLSISKFIQGLVAHPVLGVRKEKIVFIIALTIFCVVVPSLILTMKLVSSEDVPDIVAYIQPILIVVAISLYISAIRIIKNFDNEDNNGADEQASSRSSITMDTMLSSEQYDKSKE